MRLRQKEISDSTVKANAELAKRQAEEKKQMELLAIQRDKAYKDSMALALRQQKEQEKRTADSLKAAETARIATEKAQAAELAKQRELARLDSIDRAQKQALLLAVETRRKDSLSRAEAEAKARQDALDRQKAEEERKQLAALEKSRQDSMVRVQKEIAEKQEADRKAKEYAEIEARKQQLAKSNELNVDAKTGAPAAPVVAVPVIRDSDYKEGVTEQKIEDSKSTIYRVVVKKDGTVTNYQKVVYNWGGVFFYKNEKQISQTTYDQEIKQAKSSLPK